VIKRGRETERGKLDDKDNEAAMLECSAWIFPAGGLRPNETLPLVVKKKKKKNVASRRGVGGGGGKGSRARPFFLPT